MKIVPLSILWIESANHNLEMQKTMKGILRTTYLLSKELSFFYSEIFDGVFFLEWGPEEFARILGFELNQELPITIFAPTNDIEKFKLEAERLKNSSRFSMCYEDNEDWYRIKSKKWIKAIVRNIIML